MQALMGSLQRTIDLQHADEEAFITYKDRLIRYLERFVGYLQVKSADIAEVRASWHSAPTCHANP
jgi:Protein of unknown function (DUF2397)